MTPFWGPRKRTVCIFWLELALRKPQQKLKATAFRHLEVIFSSARYILFQTCVFLSGSADLLYVEPKDSNNSLTSHFLELLPDIIIQDNRKAQHVLDRHSFELQTKIFTWSSIAQGAGASFVHLHVSAELFASQDMEKNNVRVWRIQWEISLKDDK